MSLMEVMDPSGHSKHIWDAGIPAEVDAARELFKTLVKKGYRAFHVKGDGEEGKQMNEFDPQAGKLIMVPPLRGG